MRGIFSKERREKGASIIIAFVFMLICVCVCAIALGHASSASLTAQQKAENDRTYYALSSALEQAEDMFDSGSPLQDVYMTEQKEPGASSRVSFPKDAYGNELIPPTAAAGTLPNAVYHWLSGAVGLDASPTGKTLDVKVTTDAVNIPQVNLTYSLKSDYTIVVTAVPELDKDASGYQEMKIEIPRKVTATSGLYGTTYSWNPSVS